MGAEPEITFSTCFGAPFMVHRPGFYADLLKRKIERYGSNCWLQPKGPIYNPPSFYSGLDKSYFYNKLDDAEGFAEEAAESHRLGFDGKTLIHPKHIAACQEAFSPSARDIKRARQLVAACEGAGGAVSFDGEMVEAMHLASARRLLERAGVGESDAKS